MYHSLLWIYNYEPRKNGIRLKSKGLSFKEDDIPLEQQEVWRQVVQPDDNGDRGLYVEEKYYWKGNGLWSCSTAYNRTIKSNKKMLSRNGWLLTNEIQEVVGKNNNHRRAPMQGKQQTRQCQDDGGYDMEVLVFHNYLHLRYCTASENMKKYPQVILPYASYAIVATNM